MILATAQFEPTDNFSENLEKHISLIEIAAKNNAQLIVFPEMSLTNYQREKAKEMAFCANDKRLDPLIELAKKCKLTIIAGAPIQIENAIYIGSFIFLPNGDTEIYTKQYLHTGEELFFSSSFNYNPKIEIEGENIAFAICADIENPKHAESAKTCKANFYIPSIFYTENGINGGCEKLKTYATTHNFNVLMSNFCVESYGLRAGGRSSFWNTTGDLIAEMNSSETGILLIEKTETDWKGKTVVYRN